MGLRGVNEKALAARERKKQQSALSRAEVERAAEDKLWEDNDKLQQRKDQRKQAKEQKALERIMRKKERVQEEEHELNTLAASAANISTASKKITRAQLLQRQLLEAAAKKKELDEGKNAYLKVDENINHITRAETFDTALRGVEVIEARNIDEALSVLDTDSAGGASSFPSHKDARTAFRQFQERELERYKIEFPELKRSQVLERISKSWAKHPDNPHKS